MTYDCEDLEEASMRRSPIEPRTEGCEECLASQDPWVQLRLCLSCGHVGCCDSSKNKHATKHFHQTQHPVIRAFEPGAQWAYCYRDEAYAESLPARGREDAPVHYEAPA